MSKINDFTEKDIRNAILLKANLVRINKTGKHWKGYVYSGNILIGKVKIPNEHLRLMHENKSKYIANDLKLTSDQFNKFVECTFSKNDFSTHIKEL